MVLVAGQYDAGGLGRASGQLDGSVSKLNSGGADGVNLVFSASMNERTDSSVTGHSPVSPCCSATGSSPRRCLTSLASMAAHAAAPSVKPNWNAEMRSNAEPCSSMSSL